MIIDYHASKYSTNCVPFTMRSPLSVNTYTLHQACVPNTQAVSNMHNVYVSGVKINVHLDNRKVQFLCFCGYCKLNTSYFAK